MVLDPILIFGLLGAPRLGVEGAALATLIANVVLMIAALWVVCIRDRLVSFHSLSPHLVADSWRRILHVGLPGIFAAACAANFAAGACGAVIGRRVFACETR